MISCINKGKIFSIKEDRSIPANMLPYLWLLLLWVSDSQQGNCLTFILTTCYSGHC